KSIKKRERLAIIVATLITSIAFGCMHGQWNVGVNVFALSVVLCVLREITGSIYSGILVHMLKNAIAFYLLYIATIGF
ncbi:CPBP family intramembrane metalloprotease, partial [Candidatus Saccharibacteria bacterium]|nr:CPBP family intramembrane metalloprotease [Candidatus Saccharibacteria bacterium]